MKFSYNWLQSFFIKPLPKPRELADLLTFHSFEVEEVKKRGADWVLEIAILPNRAHDCAGHQEIAREIAAILKRPFKLVDYSKKIKFFSGQTGDLVKVEVRDKDLCPRYSARAVIEVKVGPSPRWMAERLEACGLRPINNIVDIANYVMLETGQPMHAFDVDKLLGRKIVVRRAGKGERIVTLDEGKYDLDESILVIADAQNPVGIAGIKGGKESGIGQNTKTVVLEAANFDYRAIRRASRQLKLTTDASWRFERELDPCLTEEVDLAAYLMQELAGGKVLRGKIDFYPKKVRPRKIILETAKAECLLGVKIAPKEIVDILRRLGFEAEATGDRLSVTVPTRRLDVVSPEDLIEEIGRIYGLEKIPGRLPSAVLAPAKQRDFLFYQNKVKEILSGFGFDEVYNYSFISGAEEGVDKTRLIELANPISAEQRYLRSDLTTNLIKNIAANEKNFAAMGLFEIGKVFQKEKDRLTEQKKVAVAALPEDFYRLKGVIDALLGKLGISDVWYDDEFERRENFYQKAEVKVGDQLLGWLGKNVFELDFDRLVTLATEERIYAPPSKYPAVIRDIALLVEPETKISEVLNLIEIAGGELVRDVDLFDIYEEEGLADGKKSLAFRIVYQSDERTLTDKEVNQSMEKIIQALEQEGKWEVRR